jgi:hypothetical protein
VPFCELTPTQRAADQIRLISPLLLHRRLHPELQLGRLENVSGIRHSKLLVSQNHHQILVVVVGSLIAEVVATGCNDTIAANPSSAPRYLSRVISIVASTDRQAIP